jgi:hypothetical protein
VDAVTPLDHTLSPPSEGLGGWRLRYDDGSASRRLWEATMHAEVGDQLLMRGRTVGERPTTAEVLEVRGQDGSPPYVIRFEDGHTGLFFPGPDTRVQPHSTAG